MATEATLSGIAAGEATPEQALSVLSEVLGSGEPRATQEVYISLRAWVWKALNARRRDPELRAWFDVLRRTAAFLKTRDAALAERVSALLELVQESIAVSERLSVHDVIRKRHVKDIIKMLAAAPDERIDRMVIGERTGLKQGNLTRVLNMVADAGLAERAANGKHAEFQLTRGGRDAADQLGLRTPTKAAGAASAKHLYRRKPRIGVQLPNLVHSAVAAIDIYRPKDPVLPPDRMPFGDMTGLEQSRALKSSLKRNVFSKPALPEFPADEASATAPSAKSRRGGVPPVEALSD